MTRRNFAKSGNSGGKPIRREVILFDLDGTLVDSAELILESYRHTMRVHFDEVPPDEVWLASFGTPLRAQFRQFVDTVEEVQQLVDTYIEHNLRVHEEYIRPFDGIAETLLHLLDAGSRLGIVTSKAARGTARSLEACGIPAEWFEVVVTSDEPVPHKPDPAPVRLALDRLRVESTTASFVGDSIWDLRAGRAAGVCTVAALWGPFSENELAVEAPDVMADRPADLK
ncbi:MAG: HAD-IA family hydrolase [Gemmatimonadota bacterium]|nr:HAD-IA family hydrolase [Gemmatimonadota bacterium]